MYYHLENISNITCVGCLPLSVTNGGVTYDKNPSNDVYKPNTVSTATCNNGYFKKGGWTTRTCQSNGNWNGYILECEKGKWKNLPLPSNRNLIVIVLNKIHKYMVFYWY